MPDSTILRAARTSSINNLKTISEVMMRLPHRYRIYNFLHKSAVYTLLTGTVLGMGLLGVQGYYYFTNVRPEKMEASRKYLEEELSKEQTAKEQELLLKQKEAETLKA